MRRLIEVAIIRRQLAACFAISHRLSHCNKLAIGIRRSTHNTFAPFTTAVIPYTPAVQDTVRYGTVDA
ncbi:hypothetical protein SAMN02787142_6357 [Burkholderia sp. WP9]|nr:hypothetical protein SAMN02787142_6357 [Burkholderia sp. WP9]